MWRTIESFCWLITLLSAAIVGVLAMWVTFRPPSRRAQWLWMTVFVLLSGTGITSAVIDHNADAREKSKRDKQAVLDRDRLSKSMDNLSESSREIRRLTQEAARMQALNTHLQQRLIRQGETLAGLAEESIKATTGGDSFCYVSFPSGAINDVGGWPVVLHVGSYPLRDVNADVVDIRAWLGRVRTPTIESALSTDANLPVGNMGQHSTKFFPDRMIPFRKGDSKQFFLIRYSAQNGFWEQQLFLRVVDDQWRQATRVIRTNDKGQVKTLLETIDPKFLKPKEKLNWDKME